MKIGTHVVRFESITKNMRHSCLRLDFVGLALVGKDIVFRFIIENSSLRDFGP
jgi:hypothetical protein